MIVGIRKEDKSIYERRIPLIPEDIKELEKSNLKIIVQSSAQRAFTDNEFTQKGVKVQNDLKEAQFIMGIKEIPKHALEPNKIYMFFSHTIKGQPYNMAMLKKLMAQNCTLIDFEKVVDEKNRRLIFFGFHAGLAGAINTLWAIGQRLKVEKIANPFSNLKQASQYHNLEEAKAALKKAGDAIATKGIPPELHPLTIGVLGYGNVGKGVQDILNCLPRKEIKPEELPHIAQDKKQSNKFIYTVTFKEEHCVKPKDAQVAFELQDYYKTGKEKYESIFRPYLDHLVILMNANYWEEKYPRMLTLDDCKQIWGTNNAKPRLKVIGDISCDVNGSIQCTIKPTYPDNPVFVYDVNNNKAIDGFKGSGPVMMAVEILPTEIPRESSIYFSNALKPFVPAIAKADFSASFEKIALPPEIKKAVIVYQGKLTPDYVYISKYPSFAQANADDPETAH